MNTLKNLNNLALLILVLICLSANSYADWKKVENLPGAFKNNYWLDVFFLPANPNYGWVCGYNGMVVRTTDGGKTWTGTSIDQLDQLESIMFVNENVGYTSGMKNSPYLAGGKIYKTVDGGKTWYDITPQTANSLWGNYFLDENNGWVIGGGCSGEEQCYYRTTNGGKTWSSVCYPAGDAGLTDLIVGEDGVGYASASGMLVKTVDFGKSWKFYAKTGSNDWQEEITHVGNTFLLPFDEGCSGSQTTGGMRISTDNGATWSQYVTGESMYGAFLLSETEGWACGFNEAIYYTNDAGKTWQKRNCGMDPGASLDDIWFIDKDHGWVVGNGIYYTYDYLPLHPIINQNDSVVLCSNQSIVLKTTENFENYLWSNGERTPSIEVKKDGEYWVKVWTSRCDSAQSNTIKIKYNYIDPVVLSVPKTNILCGDDSLRITVLNSYSDYSWSNGSHSNSIMVKDSGMYYITVKNSTGCEFTDSIHVIKSEIPKPEILSTEKQVVCKSDSVILYTKDKYLQYTWYNADTKQILQQGSSDYYKIDKSGNYYVKVANEYGCEGISPVKNVNYMIDSNKIEISYASNKNYISIDSTVPGGINCGILRLKNYTSQKAVINSIYFLKNYSFSIPQSQLPVEIEPFAEKNIDVCFSPQKIGMDSDSLIVEDVCGNLLVKVVSFGIPNTYYIDTKCGLTVKLVTIKYSGVGSISFTEPKPNPAASIANISFYTEDNKEANIQLSYKIIDRLGNVMCETGMQNLSFYNKYDLDLNIDKLTSGYYIVVLNVEGQYKAFPLIIDK